MGSPISVAAIRPEAELLVRSSRVCPSEQDAEITRALLRRRLDWSLILGGAQSHGVLPLLYRHINHACPEAVPGDILHELRDLCFDNVRSNLALTGKLFKLLDLFDAHGIHTIPYKGPTLAASAYGDLALRQFVDLDLLFRKKDVLSVKELLIARGWKAEFELTEAQEAAFLDHYYEYGFRSEEGSSLVEIHWKLMEAQFSFPIDFEGLWDRLKPITVAGREVMTLSPEDSLLIVCVHGSKHLWSRLGWICDVANLIQTHREMNWRLVLERSVRLGGKRMLEVGLLLASELLGASLPERVSRDIYSDSSARVLATDIVQRLFEEPGTPRGIIESSMFHMRMRERLRDRSRYCWRLAVTTTAGDWTAIKIPRPLFFLYYLLRPLRLAWKHARRFISRMLPGVDAR